MRIQTSRFGAIEITEEDQIRFPEGLLGFNALRNFVLLDDPHDEIFAWLQSCEEPAIAFPVLEPELFTQNYRPNLTKYDLDSLGLSSMQGARAFMIITIPEDPTKMTANLKAPIIINVTGRMARQVVLQDNQLAIREPIFTLLQQRVVQNPSVPLKTSSQDVTVKVPSKKKTAEPEVGA